MEVLRHTGIRIEELTELSHHSFVQYRDPATGGLVPLLQIAPSKTDAERLLVIAPGAGRRPVARSSAGSAAPTGPCRCVGRLRHPRTRLGTRRCRCCSSGRSASSTGPSRSSGIRALLITPPWPAPGSPTQAAHPLAFTPHDFRRIFITDAVLNGMPPHIAASSWPGTQTSARPWDTRPSTPKRSSTPTGRSSPAAAPPRPGEEYRIPTDEEWDEFLGHFERRQVALGDCGRAYGTSCHPRARCLTEMILSWDARLPGRLM